MKAKCFECAYRDRVPGSAHTKCKFAWSKMVAKLDAFSEMIAILLGAQ